MTATQTESADIQVRTGGILAQIQVGARLQFETLRIRNYYAVAAVLSGYPPLVVAGERTFGNPTFLVTMYAYDGKNQAKISLRSTTSPVGYWVAGDDIQGFSSPITIADVPGEFLLTDTGNGIISIQNIVPPPSYIRVIPPGISTYLSYGYPDPGGMAGLFNISIVG